MARELDEGVLEEWRCVRPLGDDGTDNIVPRHRGWHVVARAGDELAPTARLFLAHLAGSGDGADGDRFALADGPSAHFRPATAGG